MHEVVKLPWPGKPGLMVAMRYWPQLAGFAAMQVAGVFAAASRVSRRIGSQREACRFALKEANRPASVPHIRAAEPC